MCLAERTWIYMQSPDTLLIVFHNQNYTVPEFDNLLNLTASRHDILETLYRYATDNHTATHTANATATTNTLKSVIMVVT